jgi:peptidoglycan L-alanyl-D-glutamate endopeptidase CwlK
MSAQLFRDDILYLQRFLSCSGCYAGALDGVYGPVTSGGEQSFADQVEEIAQARRFDPRSEANIRSLQLRAQPLARRSLAALLDAGREARIISGTRTYAAQNALYRQGRFGNPGPIVTKAKGGQSWHNFGLAWDLGLFDGGRYLTASAPYAAAAAIAKIPGLEWGGDWTSFKDMPHYQVAAGGGAVSAARAAFEAGGRG